MGLMFDHTQPCDEIERTMTDYVNVNRIPLKTSIPTVLNYNELNESRMFEFYHPGDVGKVIYNILKSFGPERSWKANVCFSYESRSIHVFFDKGQEVVDASTVLFDNVIGTA